MCARPGQGDTRLVSDLGRAGRGSFTHPLHRAHLIDHILNEALHGVDAGGSYETSRMSTQHGRDGASAGDDRVRLTNDLECSLPAGIVKRPADLVGDDERQRETDASGRVERPDGVHPVTRLARAKEGRALVDWRRG